ncbi:MAG: UDP-N-acetylmuramate dehydrogenase [Gammaproteobacteria bacterium]
MIISENINISNSLKINSCAKLYIQVNTKDDFVELYKYIKNKNLPYLIVGEGTNIVLPEAFNGIVIALDFNELFFDHDLRTVRAGASVNWHNFVCECIKNDIYGFENLSLIPGSVGAAPIQNIGAYGQEVSKLIKNVYCFDLNKGEFITLDNKSCHFSYRNSVLNNNSLVVYSIDFKSDNNKLLNIEYESIKRYLDANRIDRKTLDLQSVSEIICSIRNSILPDPNIIPNAGSFFKNVIIDKNEINTSEFSIEDLIIWDVEDGMVKVGSARLIELIQNRLPKSNNVTIYSNHSLVLTTNAKASQGDVINYANEIMKTVKDVFNIKLEIEPIVIN